MRTVLYFADTDAELDLEVVPRIGETIVWETAGEEGLDHTRYTITAVSWTIGPDAKQEAHLVLDSEPSK